MRIAMRKLTKQEIKELENKPLYPTGESIPVDCEVSLPANKQKEKYEKVNSIYSRKSFISASGIFFMVTFFI